MGRSGLGAGAAIILDVMVVGLATVSLRLEGATSLKDKRSVVKRVVARTRSKFNLAVAEVDTHDRWDTVTLGLACVSTDAGHAHAVLEKAVRFIEGERLDAELLDYEIEML